MKFQFKQQPYQADAVAAVVRVFAGQSCQEPPRYGLRPGGEAGLFGADGDGGFANRSVELSDEQLLANIQAVQCENGIHGSHALKRGLGRCSLDIDMETGTGKTYVYIRTMFELNRRYGWSRFIVVVPSIAIREGVRKSMEITADHFMELYGKKARFFVYDSARLNQLDLFAGSPGINVMIINNQAFASSWKENGRSREARIIYTGREEFGSRRPIDVIRACRPILILDEPQKMGGAVTRRALENFNPLFSLNYSATHREKHNLVYVLDALDAFQKRLVKKIEVKGLEVGGLRGTDGYLYLEQILLSKSKPPRARMEMEIRRSGAIRRETRILGPGDSLYRKSGGMEQYKGLVLSEIDPARGTAVFTDGTKLRAGEAVGDVSPRDMRRIQIRETILSHFEKEEKLFNMGVKPLSLFFIDEVAKYRDYDAEGHAVLGEYGKIFEEEYKSIWKERLRPADTPYQRYLRTVCGDAAAAHAGYFSIDKRTGRSIDSRPGRGSEFSDDVSAYDLILKDKERLLSFSEPTRFLFSHSALREGWDNPNVFQICTLKHSDSQTAKRQEVGRGLRLCVNQNGDRMDSESCGEAVHEINVLTVIASESYRSFAAALQSDIREALYDRRPAAARAYFKGKSILAGDHPIRINEGMAGRIEKYLLQNGYIDAACQVTDIYREAAARHALAPLPGELNALAEGIHALVAAMDEDALEGMIGDGRETKLWENPLNENFENFRPLWEQLCHTYAYTISFDSRELIRKAAAHLNQKLQVAKPQYRAVTGRQKAEGDRSFERGKTQVRALEYGGRGQTAYDLVGRIAGGAALTRRTAAAILQGLLPEKLALFRNNPEEFITRSIRLILEIKAALAAEGIAYHPLTDTYDSAVFTQGMPRSMEGAYRAQKAVQDYVFLDSARERRFAEDLDAAPEVLAYAKLPEQISIPTPVGGYTPDWAIVFQKKTGQLVFAVVETGSAGEELEIPPVQAARLSCAEKFFSGMPGGKIRFCTAASVEELRSRMGLRE